MSKSYIDKILLKPKKKNPYSQMKPAVKDSNFYFSNCISFNMIENLTQFKNNEINSTNLNIRLLNNLSFLFAKKKIRTKKKKLKENKKKNTENEKSKKIKIIENEADFKIIEGYECYIPTKRIPVFNKRPLNEKNIIRRESSKNLKKIHREKELKIPHNLRTINFFRPCGRFIAVHNNSSSNTNSARKRSSLSINKFSDKYSDELSNSIAYTNTNTNIDEGNDDNNSSGEYSLNFGDVDDNIFHEKSFTNLLRTNPTFPKYVELTELIESPFDDVYPPDIKYKNYINIFNEFMNEEDYDDNNINNNLNSDNNNTLNIDNNNIIINNNLIIDNNNCSNNITFLSNQENSIINISDDMTDGNNEINEKSQKIFIVNPNITNKIYLNNYDKNKIPRKLSKSGKLIKINTNIFSNHNTSIINKTSLSDDIEDADDYEKGESLFAFFEKDEDNINNKNPSKKIEMRIKKILPKSASKYINNMSNQYIFLMYDQYKLISKKWEEAKSFLNDNILLKKLFIQLLKRFLLIIGISSKKFYERLIKFEIHSKEKFNFEHFMNLFNIILMDNNRENLRFKFLLLLEIIKKNDDNEEILDEKQMNIFFDLIGCEQVYIDNFCEILGERLSLRYKAIYINPNLDKNSKDKTFIYRKIKTILESFLDALDS